MFGPATWRRGTLGPWSRCSYSGIPNWRLQSKQTMLSSCGRCDKVSYQYVFSESGTNPDLDLDRSFVWQKTLQRTFVQALKTWFLARFGLRKSVAKKLNWEARPRRISRRKTVHCTYTCRVWNTLGCFQDSPDFKDPLAWSEPALFWWIFCQNSISQIFSLCLKDFPFLR